MIDMTTERVSASGMDLSRACCEVHHVASVNQSVILPACRGYCTARAGLLVWLLPARWQQACKTVGERWLFSE